MDSTRRFVIELDSKHQCTQDAIFFLDQVLALCDQCECSRIALLVPSKKNFLATSLPAAISSVWGQDSLKHLGAGRSAYLSPRVTITLESMNTINQAKQYEMVAAAYLGRKDRDVLDALAPRIVVLLPYTEDEGKEWLSSHGADVLGKGTWEAIPWRVDPAVEKELESFNLSFISSKSLQYDENKRQIRKMLSSLSRYKVDPFDIYRWALRNGWPPDDARALESMAADYFGNS